MAPTRQRVTRRQCLKTIGVTAAVAASVPFSSRPLLAFADESQRTPSEAELASMEELVRAFMHRYEVPGFSVAIARHGQFVYRKAFGWADQEGRERATPANLFRIGSVSKPITSVAIFTLIERKRLKLNDFIFGRNGVLGFDYGTRFLDGVQRITVDHLLTHTCGGWSDNGMNFDYGSDPGSYYIKMSQADLIKLVIQSEHLRYGPGTHWAYSNFGYVVLGRVIEKLSRQSYEQYVQENVLANCGVTDMRIGGNTRAERMPREVVYYNGEDVEIRRMDSCGGWIATPSDLVRFAMHVDGFSYAPSILQESSIRAMTELCPISPAEEHYARGWRVSAGNWWHNGSCPGASAVLGRTPNGICAAGFANLRTEEMRKSMDLLMGVLLKVSFLCPYQSAPTGF
jgi:CubicO group peptidase (beta-lactamase class C family)